MSVASARQDSAPAEGPPSNLNESEPSAAPHGPGPPLQIHQLSSARHRSRKLIKLRAEIAGQPAVCLVDSGASGNFISSSFVRQHNLTSNICNTEEPIKIELADGSQHVAQQLWRAPPLTISSYSDQEDFVLLPLGGYDVILGMPWLERLDPCISWRKKSLTLQHRGSSHVLESPLALHLMSEVELKRAYRKKLNQQRHSGAQTRRVSDGAMRQCRGRFTGAPHADGRGGGYAQRGASAVAARVRRCIP